MTVAYVLFPHQLFESALSLPSEIPVHLVEEDLFFTQYRFHIQKLLFHRLSMRALQARLHATGRTCQLWELRMGDVTKFFAALKSSGVTEARLYDVTDDWLEKRITKAASQNSISIVFNESPSWLTRITAQEKQHSTYRFMPFYEWQRKRLKILIEDNGKPTGGKWSYDEENRKRLPKKIMVPAYYRTESIADDDALIVRTKNDFPDCYGEAASFAYEVTHEGARKELHRFLQERFELFGPYEDAIDEKEVVLFHSVLSPFLNSGLITPDEVVRETLAHAKTNDISLNTIEGFLRQVIGWREYIRAVYILAGREQRNKNYFKHTRKMPGSFWEGSTGLIPFDTVVHKLQKHAYCHHIERLMICGNLFLLCEFDPEEVYRWFMTFFIDAYDWVMVPNVYGMSQYADGGLMITKPYVSSSNYILKMSNFKRGTWCDIWDGLYWRFIDKHRALFSSNGRTTFSVRLLDKMDEGKRISLLAKADSFLAAL